MSYYDSEGWQEKRERIIERDDGLCVMCGEEGHIVHHKTYDRFENEEDNDIELLCEDCHKSVHGQCD